VQANFGAPRDRQAHAQNGPTGFLLVIGNAPWPFLLSQAGRRLGLCQVPLRPQI